MYLKGTRNNFSYYMLFLHLKLPDCQEQLQYRSSKYFWSKCPLIVINSSGVSHSLYLLFLFIHEVQDRYFQNPNSATTIILILKQIPQVPQLKTNKPTNQQNKNKQTKKGKKMQNRGKRSDVKNCCGQKKRTRQEKI